MTWELCQLQILVPWFQLVPVSPELESLSLQGHKKRYYDQEEVYPLQEMFKNTWTPYLVFLSYYRNIIFLAKGGFVTTEYMFNYHSFLLITTLHSCYNIHTCLLMLNDSKQSVLKCLH